MAVSGEDPVYGIFDFSKACISYRKENPEQQQIKQKQKGSGPSWGEMDGDIYWCVKLIKDQFGGEEIQQDFRLLAGYLSGGGQTLKNCSGYSVKAVEDARKKMCF